MKPSWLQLAGVFPIIHTMFMIVCLVVQVDAQPEYARLSSVLSETYTAVQSQARDYLSTEFITDPTVRRPRPATASATSNLRHFGYEGVKVQKDHLLLQLTPDADKNHVTTLLQRYDLTVKSGVPSIGLLIVALGSKTPAVVQAAAMGDRSAAAVSALRNTVEALRAEPIVRTVALNVLLGPTVLPPPSNGSGKDHWGTVYHWSWDVGEKSWAAKRLDGNWGQKFVRFPAAWNFTDAIKARGNKEVAVGVLDVGFGDQEALTYTLCAVTNPKLDDHGNHVMGIIAAKHDNKVGVNGGTPFAKVTACSAAALSQASSSTIPELYLILSDIIATLVKFILESPDLKVLNISLGYNWVPNYQRNPNTDREIQDFVHAHGTIVRSIADLAAERGIIIVSAAGNDSNTQEGFSDIQAQYASPFNWAGLNSGISQAPARNILVVESIGRTGALSPFSNVGGHLSAPGENILSTMTFNESSQHVENQYGVMSGTSMATPHVTALIALMYAYNPDLTLAQVVDIIIRTARPAASQNTAPTIDAFAALLACRDRALKDLADLNNDGKVDMADFTLFKEALQQIEGHVEMPKDLNGDGKISENENIYPRTDLNGSGELSRDPKDKRTVLGEALSDLEVMMKVWEDPSVPAADLPNRL